MEAVTMITGAASGIGRATAVRLARRGDTVMLVDVDERGLAQTADAVDAVAGEQMTRVLDVRDRRAIERACASTTMAREGGITHVVCAAGVTRHGPVASMTLADWTLVLETHLTSVFHCAQVVLPQMVERETGTIVIVSSDFAVTGMAGGANYAAAKTALYSLTKTLALEFAPHGIRVNAVGPGKIDTPLLRGGRSPQEWEKVRRTYERSVPMGRLGRPEEVAAVIDFLSSDRAAFVTGQLVQPNGGQVIW
jgi:NAD(P)-dependent dehydrogenase (short-subunit alcohol dehydrogenase family)